ncbi:ABC transporter ATP-binding protein [Chloroflexi bacterium TSY]|nr:ABC transporter ATP-binding protein [Chloroflexi bacterium TSY]
MESKTVPSENGLAIETQDLWRIYKLGGQEIQALRGVNLQIEPGSFISLKGRSGSGKTTLLNCLGGLDQPTKGTVRIFGEEIDSWSERQLTAWRRHQVGFIFQSLGLLPALSAYENVELMLRMTGAKAKERRQRSMDCLELVGLTKWADHRPYEMSGGQQQRVAIARALANAPKLIIADEPTGELDSNTAMEVLELFRAVVKAQDVTMLMATHDSLSDEIVDEVLRLEDGQIISNEEYLALEEGEHGATKPITRPTVEEPTEPESAVDEPVPASA